jgi:tRNA A-37 threonylcarbamoyl transferase component Bud32
MKKSLGRYKIIKEIGRGAMGIVYQGYDPKIDRVVALKTIRKDRLAESRDVEDLVMRFQKEVQATGKLVHPNIIVIYDTGEDKERAYIAMEYVEGDTLENVIQKGIRFPMEKIIDMIEQICDGLEYTHGQGIVHRDLKPSNIMLVQGKKVKIADFGISKAVGAASSPLTQAGILLGTPSYMSPEQIAGTEINGRSDLFSLGIILYQLLTGEKPFVGDNIPTLLYNIVNKDPVSPSQVDSSIPSVFDDVITKALAKDPDKRYRRARDFVEDLKRAHRGEALIEAPSTEATMTAAQGVWERIYPKRKPYGLLAGFAILLFVLVLGGYYWMHKTQRLAKEEEISEMRVKNRVTPPIEKEPVKPIPPPAPMGTIVVSSIPPGASVLIDGVEHKEPTPTVIEEVVAGEKHEIKVVKRGFEAWALKRLWLGKSTRSKW